MKLRRIFVLILALVLALPLSSWAAKYTVVPGDVLWKIAKNNATTIDKLVELNKIKNPNILYAGQSLILPEAAPKAFADSVGIGRISISVSDLTKSRDFYVTDMELEEVCSGSLTAEQCKALYGVSSTAQYILLKNEIQLTYLQLIEFEQKSGKFMRTDQPSWNYGYFDVAFRARDSVDAFQTFAPRGFEFPCPPYSYLTPWSGAEVKESVMYGPDRVPHALIEGSKKPAPFEGDFHNFTDVVTVVESMDVSDRFFTGVLGLNKVFDMTMPNGLVDPVVGVPLGVETRIAMYVGGKTPIVEILEFSKKGTSMETVAVPPNAGLFCTSFQVDSVYETLALSEKNGFSVKREPYVYELAPYGKIRSAFVGGPNGVLVELFEVLK